MKTILAGTDFSPSSLNACNYAGYLAKKLNCKLVIFNLFEIPAAHTNSGFYFISYNVLKENSNEKLIKTSRDLQNAYPKLKIQALAVGGDFRTEIENFLKHHHVQVVVLGLAVKNQLSKFIYGSRSTDIAGKINAPVIIVPEQYKKYKLKNLLLGIDNVEKVKKSALHQFKNLANELKLKIKPLHIRTKNELFYTEKPELPDLSKQQKVDTFFANDVAEGLTKYSIKKDFDLLTVISRNHSGFYDLFSESVSKKIAFVSKLPVMCVHE